MTASPPKIRSIRISQTIRQSLQTRTVTAMSARPPSFASNFPTSTAEPSAYFKWPGITWDSTKAVREVLEENNRGYDIYESRRFAHNHFPHSVFSRYAFGAPPKLIHDCWNHDKTHLVSLDPAGPDRKDVDETKVPKRINREDWGNHLGNKGCYAPYLVFFHDEIARLGPQGVLEEYIFSPQANWETFTDPSGKDQGPPNMFNRLLAGAIHPFIHTGFGLEFNDRVVLAEGLAETAVHPDVIVNLVIPPSHIQPLFTTPSTPRPSSSPSLLSIYTSLLSSPTLKPQPYDPESMVNDQLKSSVDGPKASELRALVDRWSLSDEEVADGPDGWQKKFEEITVFVTLLACATGRKGKEIRVDFFLMHALTSSIFLPAYLTRLTPSLRRALLKRYILEAFHTALARGRPPINPELIMSYDLYPTINTEGSEEALKKLVKEDKALGKGEKEERNPWLSLVESAMVYPDSHVIKSIRSLAHYASLLGNSPPGGLPGAYKEEGGDGKEEAVKGMGKLDGSVFLRAAGAIMTTMEPGGEGAWDRSQLGYDEAWE
ncbi:hypothetical protein CNAG_07308 [Cryptococcus neoformans var. grubii H99]|uniref:Uncharacterized protein n=1 Tax=Cryptococcus neoformans (strain H99 / ATCC 208821 / CBS 10515 / FGSC 9487) TaxID=235443 RepID=J9VKF1_CRYN9|nr:hypothetical protein CNAG_07308 [Cryptococcus neoformans var. grubii H99]AFR92180.2 hypothetical protein CNAG_07308 [Cryptococcus neoformans var. grubii H99]AUB21582.1 hypothetical protein CKF44_07308 [Cryptococcus neoformans var. grubii]|eukprot:XP_012046164.1 hypothetical protein CNAG_07308 [Cryptococcus neoformans var. grubii H99]